MAFFLRGPPLLLHPSRGLNQRVDGGPCAKREAELLRRARAKDREAITQLVVAHQEMVRNYLFRHAPDPSAADDLAQEVFLAGLKSLERIDPAMGIRPYLMGIARNLVREAWRRRLPVSSVGFDSIVETLAAPAGDKEDGPNADLRLDALRVCMARLTPKVQNVINRHYAGEERCEDIARSLGVAVTTVRSTLTRARKALLECMRPKLADLAGPAGAGLKGAEG